MFMQKLKHPLSLKHVHTWRPEFVLSEKFITLHYITLHYITLHYITLHYITLHYITLHYITLHYITLSAFQTPPSREVVSGASTIKCYTKYSPTAQHAGQLHIKSGTTKKENQLCSGANCNNTHNIISSMAPHELF